MNRRVLGVALAVTIGGAGHAAPGEIAVAQPQGQPLDAGTGFHLLLPGWRGVSTNPPRPVRFTAGRVLHHTAFCCSRNAFHSSAFTIR